MRKFSVARDVKNILYLCSKSNCLRGVRNGPRPWRIQYTRIENTVVFDDVFIESRRFRYKLNHHFY